MRVGDDVQGKQYYMVNVPTATTPTPNAPSPTPRAPTPPTSRPTTTSPPPSPSAPTSPAPTPPPSAPNATPPPTTKPHRRHLPRQHRCLPLVLLPPLRSAPLLSSQQVFTTLDVLSSCSSKEEAIILNLQLDTLIFFLFFFTSLRRRLQIRQVDHTPPSSDRSEEAGQVPTPPPQAPRPLRAERSRRRGGRCR